MLKRKQLINNRTGEIYKTESEYFSEAMNNEGYRFPSHKAGARLFDDVKFPSEMKPSEIGRMTILSKEMIGSSNLLGYRQGRNIFAYTANEIGELVRLRESKGRSFVARMCRLRLMQRIVTTSGPQYYINPAYFMASGHRLSMDLFLLFRAELTPIIPTWVINDFLRQAKEKQQRDFPMSLDVAIDILENVGRVASGNSNTD
jgi:hypothetical protein